jgi:hypothetical protein
MKFSYFLLSFLLSLADPFIPSSPIQHIRAGTFSMPIIVLIEGDMLTEKVQAKVNVGSLEEFKTAVARVAKIRIDKFDLLVMNTEFGEWCKPLDFDSLGDKVKAKLVTKQLDANEDEETTFAIDTQKFMMPRFASPLLFLSLLVFLFATHNSRSCSSCLTF